jgi:D-alanyl-D-alanine dipeptidase
MKKVYDWRMFLKIKTVKALKANEIFKKQGLRIKLFDCYRPLDIQKKMWKIIESSVCS